MSDLKTQSKPPYPTPRQKLHALFSDWTAHPLSESRFGEVKAAMLDFELKARLRRSIPLSDVS